MIALDEVLKNLTATAEPELNKTAANQPAEPEINEDEAIKAAELEGRAMARGFFDEMQKQAVDTDPIQISPDHGQTPGNMNPAVQVSTAGGAVGSSASQVINSLISRVGQNGGVIQTPAGTVAAAQTQVMAPPTPAEIARQQASAEAAAKTASDYIIETLYNLHLA